MVHAGTFCSSAGTMNYSLLGGFNIIFRGQTYITIDYFPLKKNS